MRRLLAWISHRDRRLGVIAVVLLAAGMLGMASSIIYTRSYKPTGNWPALHRRMRISNGIMWTSMAVMFAGQMTGMVAAGRKARRRERVSKGLCLECGYDLRESPERCPECGTAPVASPPKQLM